MILDDGAGAFEVRALDLPDTEGRQLTTPAVGLGGTVSDLDGDGLDDLVSTANNEEQIWVSIGWNETE